MSVESPEGSSPRRAFFTLLIINHFCTMCHCFFNFYVIFNQTGPEEPFFVYYMTFYGRPNQKNAAKFGVWQRLTSGMNTYSKKRRTEITLPKMATSSTMMGSMVSFSGWRRKWPFSL